MRTKLVASALALLMYVLFVPPLFAGESSPAVKLAAANIPYSRWHEDFMGKVTVRVTIDHAGAVKDARVAEGHPMLRDAAVNVAQQWKFEEGAAQERVATLKFSFVVLPPSSKVQGQTQSRQNPRAFSKTSAILQDVSAGILRAQTTRCAG